MFWRETFFYLFAIDLLRKSIIQLAITQNLVFDLVVNFILIIITLNETCYNHDLGIEMILHSCSTKIKVSENCSLSTSGSFNLLMLGHILLFFQDKLDFSHYWQ